MATNTHIEIISAQAQRFNERPADSVTPLGRLYASTVEFANKLIMVPNTESSQFFTDECRSLKVGLQLLLTQLKQIPYEKETASDELRWLQENTRLLTTALQQVSDLSKAENTPLVQGENGNPVPRTVAIARSYLAAVKFLFDDTSFAAHLDALQESIILNVAEVWNLPLCLKLVLLEEAITRGLQLVKHPTGVHGVADCLRSMHHVAQASWKEVLETRIVIDRVLRQDPAGAFAGMDFESREHYWNTVADIASHCDFSEMDVALEALSLAQQAERGSRNRNSRLTARRSHVGYYLLAEGLATLQRKVDWRPPLRQKLVSLVRRHPNAYYLQGMLLLTLTLVAAVLLIVGNTHSLGLGLLAAIALLLPASQVALELMNTPTTMLLPAQVLPKLDFSEGIPDPCATVVAVPVLLFTEEQVRQLVDDLEVRYLGNRDRNLHFALLTDLPDSKEPSSEDSPLVALCAELINNLNAKYKNQGRGSFLLLHRHRVYNPSEKVWMGWERKRGKLMDFARLLRGQYDSFPVKVADLSLLPQVRFVITLDADTELPRGSAHRLVGAMAHPLNQAIIDPAQKLVVSGYGILQPRIGVSIQSASRSRLAKIYSGQTGIDIYTRAVSDVYQDLYGEGIFTGKGIWEVDALLHALEGRFPENALLSHDLIEGVYARTGLISDVQLIDDYPSHYSAYSRRKHRWIRGDWQIADWLLPRIPDASGNRVTNPLSLVSKWKIFDNLRRSLVEPALLVLFVLGWLVLPGPALRWTMAALALMFLPAWFHGVLALSRSAWKRNWGAVKGAFHTLLAENLAALLRLAFLAHQTLLSFDAIVRVLIRKRITRHKLLEWETAAEAELGKARQSPVDSYLAWAPALLIGLLLWIRQPGTLLTATPILLLWACAVPMAQWLDESPRKLAYEVSAEDRSYLRRIAVRTWRYFAEYSNHEHNWLIPDNYQENPVKLADRTSPTDLGLLLNARQAACEFGYLTVPEFEELTSHTLATLEALPKHRGHLFNWYNTRTLEPLPPRFVSTADSGNLAASLWSLQQGCLDRLRRPLLEPSLLEGFLDHLHAFAEENTFAILPQPSAELSSNATGWLKYMEEATATLPRSENFATPGAERSSDWFAVRARELQKNVIAMVQLYCPWLLPEFSSVVENPILHLKGREEWDLEELPAIIDVVLARLESAAENATGDERARYAALRQLTAQARENATRLIESLRSTAARAAQLANDMDFAFLFSSWRKLMSIGFDFEKQQLHGACYDLLASEARLGLFVAIAKEDVPQESWFLMGRPHTVVDGRPVLLSWTGTMFEYLMPALWMRTYAGTLMDRSLREAVRAQQLYAAHKHIPWGISESAYAVQDESGNYQYHAFGVPTLAVHKQDEGPVVVSPYSTALALTVDTGAAMDNLRRIDKEGWLGTYGFYEAADFGQAARSSRRHSAEVVRCWMAHHQGMSLLAITNLLRDGALQRWFHSSPRVQATELLLQEKPVVTRERQQALESATVAA